jgi:uncharacterized membrane protein YfcA
LQTATQIVASGLIVQGYAVWKLRHALDWRRLWPFVAGAAAGVPVGVAVVTWASPAYVRAGVDVLLVLYSLYTWFRPTVKPIAAGPAADIGVGFLNGALAGLTGLAGILVTIWCGARGWPKDQQRAVFQSVAVAIFVITAGWIGAKARSRQIRCGCSCSACLRCSQAPGSASNSTAGSTKPRSGKSRWCCCCCRAQP